MVGKKELSIETGRMAKQADGAVVVRYGDTMVLVTAVANDTPREGVDFLPLTVDYVEKTSAAGKIPGGYFKREGRPTEAEILTCRLIDRPSRPLFKKGWRNESQIIALVLSSDRENPSDVLAMTGASTALHISDVPWDGPFAGVRVGRLRGELRRNLIRRRIHPGAAAASHRAARRAPHLPAQPAVRRHARHRQCARWRASALHENLAQ